MKIFTLNLEKFFIFYLNLVHIYLVIVKSNNFTRVNFVPCKDKLGAFNSLFQ